jgi:hypothetical protein
MSAHPDRDMPARAVRSRCRSNTPRYYVAPIHALPPISETSLSHRYRNVQKYVAKSARPLQHSDQNMDRSRDVSALDLVETLLPKLRQKTEYPAANSMVAANNPTTETAMIVS